MRCCPPVNESDRNGHSVGRKKQSECARQHDLVDHHCRPFASAASCMLHDSPLCCTVDDRCRLVLHAALHIGRPPLASSRTPPPSHAAPSASTAPVTLLHLACCISHLACCASLVACRIFACRILHVACRTGAPALTAAQSSSTARAVACAVGAERCGAVLRGYA